MTFQFLISLDSAFHSTFATHSQLALDDRRDFKGSIVNRNPSLLEVFDESGGRAIVVGDLAGVWQLSLDLLGENLRKRDEHRAQDSNKRVGNRPCRVPRLFICNENVAVVSLMMTGQRTGGSAYPFDL